MLTNAITFKAVAIVSAGVIGLGAPVSSGSVAPVSVPHAPRAISLLASTEQVAYDDSGRRLNNITETIAEDDGTMAYPCQAGWHLRQGEGGDECVPCSAGRFRASPSTICERCQKGAYNTEAGQELCQECPEGADCETPGLDTIPDSDEGYYAFFLGIVVEPMYEPCSPMSVCLGGNRCEGANTGPLCQQCKPGYTNQGFFDLGSTGGRCVECPPLSQNVFLVALLVGMYSMYAYVAFRAAQLSARSVRNLHSVILKIVMNYLVFAYVAFRATGLWDESAREAQLLLSGSAASDEAIYISFTCLVQPYGWNLITVHTWVALLIMPLVLSVNFVILVSRNIVLLLRVCTTRRTPANPRQQLNDRSWTWQGSVVSWGSAESEAVAECSEAEDVARSQSRKRTSMSDMIYGKDWADFRLAMRQSSIIWVFVLYPGVVGQLLKGTACDSYDHLRLRGYIDILCFEGEHLDIFALCLAGLVLYGLGIPLVFFMLLHSNRKLLVTPAVREKYGFLYNGFVHRRYYYECIYMLRKLLVLMANSIPQYSLRCVFIVCLGLMFIGSHKYSPPFDDRDYRILDKMELMNIWSLVVTALSSLAFLAFEQAEESYIRDIVLSAPSKASLVLLATLANLTFWYYAFYGLVRSLLVRPLKLRSQAGMQLKRWQKLLLWTMEQSTSLGNTVTFNAQRNSLDLTKLSKKERDFLSLAVKGTLDCYMACSKTTELHPDAIATALQEAFSLCMRTRRHQVEWLRRHPEINVPVLAPMRAAAASSLRRLRRVPKAVASTMSAGSNRSKDGSKKIRRGSKLRARKSKLLMPQLQVRRSRLGNLGRTRTGISGSCFNQEVYVEEIYDSLMVLWPEVRSGWEELHRLPSGTTSRATTSWQTPSPRGDRSGPRVRFADEATHSTPGGRQGKLVSTSTESRRSLRLAGLLVLQQLRTAKLKSRLERETWSQRAQSPAQHAEVVFGEGSAPGSAQAAGVPEATDIVWSLGSSPSEVTRVNSIELQGLRPRPKTAVRKFQVAEWVERPVSSPPASPPASPTRRAAISSDADESSDASPASPFRAALRRDARGTRADEPPNMSPAPPLGAALRRNTRATTADESADRSPASPFRAGLRRGTRATTADESPDWSPASPFRAGLRRDTRGSDADALSDSSSASPRQQALWVPDGSESTDMSPASPFLAALRRDTRSTHESSDTSPPSPLQSALRRDTRGVPRRLLSSALRPAHQGSRAASPALPPVASVASLQPQEEDGAFSFGPCETPTSQMTFEPGD